MAVAGKVTPQWPREPPSAADFVYDVGCIAPREHRDGCLERAGIRT
jgi:hypothetical protein